MKRLILNSSGIGRNRFAVAHRAALLVCFVIVQGCSTTSSPDYASLGLIDVRGTLTLDGTPLSNVEVRFETPDEGIYSYAVTDDSGRYRLMFDSRTRGILPGRKRILVLSKGRSEAEALAPQEKVVGSESGEAESQDASSEPSSANRIPKCYGRQSKKFIDVSSDTKVIDIDLKSDCSDAL